MLQEKLYPGWFPQFGTRNRLKLRYTFISILITLIILSFPDVVAAQKPYRLSRSSFINTFIPGDRDRDGLLDTAEERLANAFAPYLVFHKNEGCCNGLIVIYQMTPRTPKKIYFRLVLLFPIDCMGDSHNGDSQSSGYYLVSMDGLNWVLENRRGNYEWSEPQSDGRRHPKLYVSKDKHRLWLTSRECVGGKKNHNICGGGHEILAKFGTRYISGSNSFNTRLRLNGNAGERPYGYRFYSLEPYGFPNEDVYSEDCFCGGKKRSNHCEPYWKGLRDCADPVSTKWIVFNDNKNSLLNVSPPNISNIILRGGGGWGKSRSATAIAFGDVDGDGRDEVGIGRDFGGNERYWILDDANRKFNVLYRGGRGWGDSNYVTSIAFGDVRGDGKDEVGIARYYRSNSRIKRMKYSILEYRRRSFLAFCYGGHTWGSSNFATDIAFGKIYRGQKMSLGVTRKATGNFGFLFAGDIKCAKTYITGGSSSIYCNSIAFGDVDGDGKMEAGVTRYVRGNWRYIIIKFN